ncbi:uncharacterized protein LOC135510550 isoform X2 [Oncorhynchus masou masou]|uniref:uncharacterized protein LOC135510550 isoform X2 n=1 Tax=Oncorhynchus masou masou TaxID=90313 RepID=UPI003182F90A
MCTTANPLSHSYLTNKMTSMTVCYMKKIYVLFRTALSLAVVVTQSVWSTFTLGDAVDLECFITVDDDDRTSPRCYLCILTAIVFGEFDKKLCFATRKSGTRFVLTISDSTTSNMGMYYCAAIDYESMIFRSCVFLKHQVLEKLQIPGPSMLNSSWCLSQSSQESLNCKIHTETCAGEHSVYWFRRGSGESHPGIIYTHGDRSDQCEKSPEAGSPTQSCVYNLPKRNLILSDAGTYYCAVASCGEIVFWNETKLDVEGTGVLLCCLTIITYTTRK